MVFILPFHCSLSCKFVAVKIVKIRRLIIGLLLRIFQLEYLKQFELV